LVAGVDISTAQACAHAAIVTLRFPELDPIEAVEAELPLSFPYVPGLLAFREAPAVLAAAGLLRRAPDLFIIDGHGLAHPRRMGLACHIGLFLDRPTIGCAKSLLCGQVRYLGPSVGDCAEILDDRDTIGAAVRTRRETEPVYVSIGHKVDLATAISWVLRCCASHRLPEPTRWAHRIAGGEQLPGSAVRSESGALAQETIAAPATAPAAASTEPAEEGHDR
jgi:deoxyribonuclease V